MVSEKEPKNNLNNFFQNEYSALKGYVRSKISYTTESDAEDIIQDVALKIFSRPIDALPIHNIGGFVYSAIRNRIIDVLRTRKEHIHDENTIETLWTSFAEQFYTGTESAYSEALKEKLKNSVMNLKPAYRDIVLAIDFEGYSYQEIAEETGIPRGTLMSRRHRAMSILLKKIESKT